MITFHPHILQRFVSDKKRKRSFLIQGPDRVGKYNLLLNMAQLVICKEKSDDGLPCGHCNTCRKIADNNFPDVKIIAPLRMSDVVTIQRFVLTKSRFSRYKVIVLPSLHNASIQALNGLLKVLEEPPHWVYFLMSAEEDVLDTVKSRCHLYRASLVAESTIASCLEIWFPGVDSSEIARRSSGYARWAWEAAQNPLLLDEQSLAWQSFRNIFSLSMAERIEIGKQEKRVEQIKGYLVWWLMWWRKIIHSDHQDSFLTVLTARVSHESVLASLLSTEETLRRITYTSVNSRIAITNMLLAYPFVDEKYL